MRPLANVLTRMPYQAMTKDPAIPSREKPRMIDTCPQPAPARNLKETKITAAMNNHNRTRNTPCCRR